MTHDAVTTDKQAASIEAAANLERERLEIERQVRKAFKAVFQAWANDELKPSPPKRPKPAPRQAVPMLWDRLEGRE
jgi:hypothetical protein